VQALTIASYTTTKRLGVTASEYGRDMAMDLPKPRRFPTPTTTEVVLLCVYVLLVSGVFGASMVLAWRMHGPGAVDVYFHFAYIILYGIYGYRYVNHKYPKSRDERLEETGADVSYGTTITEPLILHQRNQAVQRAFGWSFWCVIVADFFVEMTKNMWMLMANFIIVHISSPPPVHLYVALGSVAKIVVVDIMGSEIKRFADRRG